MRRGSRLLLATGVLGTAGVLATGIAGLPRFGHVPPPYGVRAVGAGLGRHTSNIVASLTFDQRGFDTAGEEFIMFAAAVSAVMLLRRMRDEDESHASHHYGSEDVFGALRVSGAAYLPVTLLVGCYIILHGQVTPGGGFQGGVVLATGFHLAYLAGDYRVLEKLRPLPVLDAAEAFAAIGFLLVGLAGLVAAGSFLANWLPLGQLRTITSAGTVPILNAFVGIEVGAATVLLLSRFLDQALLVRRPDESSGG